PLHHRRVVGRHPSFEHAGTGGSAHAPGHQVVLDRRGDAAQRMHGLPLGPGLVKCLGLGQGRLPGDGDIRAQGVVQGFYALQQRFRHLAAGKLTRVHALPQLVRGHVVQCQWASLLAAAAYDSSRMRGTLKYPSCASGAPANTSCRARDGRGSSSRRTLTAANPCVVGSTPSVSTACSWATMRRMSLSCPLRTSSFSSDKRRRAWVASWATSAAPSRGAAAGAAPSAGAPAPSKGAPPRASLVSTRINSSNSSSDSTGTPSCRARSSLEPGFSPATTKSVLRLTELLTWPPCRRMSSSTSR